MTITIENYFETMRGLRLADLPEIMQKVHQRIKEETDAGKNWAAYYAGERKRIVQRQFKLLKSWLQKSKKLRTLQGLDEGIKRLHGGSKAYRLVNRYCNLDGTTKSKNQIRFFLNAIAAYFNSSTQEQNELNKRLEAMFDNFLELHNSMKEDDRMELHLSAPNQSFFYPLVGREQKLQSAKLLFRVKNRHGKKTWRHTLSHLRDLLLIAVDAGDIPAYDPFYHKVVAAAKILKAKMEGEKRQSMFTVRFSKAQLQTLDTKKQQPPLGKIEEADAVQQSISEKVDEADAALISDYLSMAGNSMDTSFIMGLCGKVMHRISTSGNLPEGTLKKLQHIKTRLKVFLKQPEQGGVFRLNETDQKLFAEVLKTVQSPPKVPAKREQPIPDRGLPEGFLSMADIGKREKHQLIRLNGALGEMLGELERFKLAITIEGEQGSGKSTLVYQLANSLADKNLKVGMWSLEMGSEGKLITQLRDRYIHPANLSSNRVAITESAKDGLDTIRKIAKYFDVIIIDSWNKLDAHSSEFDRLRHEFPDKIFIVIFQRTSGGEIRGGPAPLYDAGINIVVYKNLENDQENYAVCEKNRYNRTGIPYKLFQAA